MPSRWRRASYLFQSAPEPSLWGISIVPVMAGHTSRFNPPQSHRSGESGRHEDNLRRGGVSIRPRAIALGNPSAEISLIAFNPFQSAPEPSLWGISVKSFMFGVAAVSIRPRAIALGNPPHFNSSLCMALRAIHRESCTHRPSRAARDGDANRNYSVVKEQRRSRNRRVVLCASGSRRGRQGCTNAAESLEPPIRANSRISRIAHRALAAGRQITSGSDRSRGSRMPWCSTRSAAALSRK